MAGSLRIGVLGLGRAGASMLAAMAVQPDIRVSGGKLQGRSSPPVLGDPGCRCFTQRRMRLRLSVLAYAKHLLVVAIMSGLVALMLGTEYAPEVPGVVVPLWLLSGMCLVLSLAGVVFSRRRDRHR